ncbi:chromosome segregation protein SMC [Methylocapsa sp. D3K7]|uniref:chromosome segregation protein SMC n=1 Tax=Methylocapsa sp. D3K7 TaxID=3041435 RepID=UPI00244E9138|nr:chromosome segregation protein SMC [Methylocapsa sp. D3K7]WGJ15569.1 chromosome segregation protein SMC [Methylocapsa sp. D3K7]
MKLTKLRIAGFKTFVDPAEFHIEPGLTGIVGPNGCGKSNLVEALRWVMGESSSKNMRASGMDDVIFSGGGDRPARNMAEVVLFLDNSDRTAPASFNDGELIEVSRRIERESGSTYRVNGREVRARDVQLLFADASTGSRSTAMVRQGQIGEIIAAKPQERRRILEEAAGIAGLHSRRHEAELRLKAAEENLRRLDDILQQIDGQAESLKKQARQATRYRGLAAEIRRNEALLALIHRTEAAAALQLAESKLEEGLRDVAEKTLAQAEAAKLQAIAAHELPQLRSAEAEVAGELQRLVLARETLDGEERRAKSRTSELERRIAQTASDIARETALINDAAAVLARLDTEAAGLASSGTAVAEIEAARGRLAEAEANLALTEKALAEAQDTRSVIEARRAALETALREETARMARLQAEIEKVTRERDTLLASAFPGADLDQLQAALDEAAGAAKAREDELAEAEARHAEARAAELAARAPLAEAERKAQNLETQIATLSKLLNAGTGGFWPAVTEEISVAKGYEAAIGAALGDDLDASTNPASPAHWAATDASDDPALPPGVEALAKRVTAPAPLARRLNQIGVVLRAEGSALRTLLKPGQRLVSKEGDLWRWDGFTQAAEAPTPAARRLAEKNRLGDLAIEAEAARAAASALKINAEQALTALTAAGTAERDTRQAHKDALRKVEGARDEKTAGEKRQTEMAARLSALDEASIRIETACTEASQKRAQAEDALAQLELPGLLTAQLDKARAAAAQDRAMVAEARAALQSYLRDAEMRAKRLQAIKEERQSWGIRDDRARGQIGELEARHAEGTQELQKLLEAPNTFLVTRQTLMRQIEAAEDARKKSADKRVAAETRLGEADRAARGALEAMSMAREEKARSEAWVEAARARRDEVAHMIAADIGCTEAELFGLAQATPGDALPPAEAVEKKLDALKGDRERLGGVNLRADEELNEILASKTTLSTEHEDLTEAIRRLRQAVQSLNKEGRERLLGAFDAVHAHFKELFTTLFGGGSAELQLIESDDPLEAGLEILVHPPGKKPQVMTLLSGGEQALAAMSLIFAIFLTNPSPVCVLDEVDAPLDDANVERFCDLLETMRAKTETRFITVTHNPITMARMNRLFGVTMAERGISQLVSVDLEEAERFREAG